MSKGYLFQTSIEDELKKINVEGIRRRLSLELLEPIDELGTKITRISLTIKECYNCNLLQIHSAIIIYAYVKWLITSSSK
ncbi:hypothetical protein COV12_01190 [Candidatus Woesearchaeota archaeon CG10_big_fil_rev_8_21_14_0_10_32_24]|nr:MAG: hypothetical protein COV12_01190 [Candidatus Woesearchaeota archaeon CG10_big_fil_rev_8_21_14_0_10_32_24]